MLDWIESHREKKPSTPAEILRQQLRAHGSNERCWWLLGQSPLTSFEIPHFLWVAAMQHLCHQVIVVRRLVARISALKRLPVIGKDSLKDTPGPCGCCQHLRPPSEGLRIVTVPWLYHGSSSLSTPPQCVQGIPFHRRGNCLQIKHKK